MREEKLKDLPYTIVGGTANPIPLTSIILTAEGIKELAKRMKAGDMVKITKWCDYNSRCNDVKYYSDFTLLRIEEKNE